jgi:hypothetical protein
MDLDRLNIDTLRDIMYRCRRKCNKDGNIKTYRAASRSNRYN